MYRRAIDLGLRPVRRPAPGPGVTGACSTARPGRVEPAAVRAAAAHLHAVHQRLSVLLSVDALWVSRGGSGRSAPGELPRVHAHHRAHPGSRCRGCMRRFGHRVALGAGLLFLGGPTPLLALSASWRRCSCCPAARRRLRAGHRGERGTGCRAEYRPPSSAARRRCSAWATASRSCVAADLVGVVEHLGFTGVFVAAPSAARPAAAGADPAGSGGVDGRPSGAGGPELAPGPGFLTWWRWSAGAVRAGRLGGGRLVAMLGCRDRQGALVTFLPLAVTAPGTVVPVALLGTRAGRCSAGGGAPGGPGAAGAAVAGAGVLLARRRHARRGAGVRAPTLGGAVLLWPGRRWSASASAWCRTIAGGDVRGGRQSAR